MQVPLRNCEEYFIHDSPVLSFTRLSLEKYVSLTKTSLHLWYRSQTDARQIVQEAPWASTKLSVHDAEFTKIVVVQ